MQKTTPQIGTVISYFGSSVAVEADDGQVFQCQLRRNQELPLVGDRVHWEISTDNTGTIVGIEPRRSVLARGEKHGKSKALAANIDMMVVVMPPSPGFSEVLVDRYTVAAEILKIEPLIILNKADLMPESTRAEMNERLQVYRDIPYSVLMASVKSGEGMEEMVALMANKSCVLMGPSGVGKSSIIGRFVQDDIRIGDVSPKGAGKHTTTATRLYHLPRGGYLVDSPGVRDFNLWQVSRNEVWQGFREFQPYLTGCRFRDCQHLVEPGCRLLEALADGKIARNRFSNYLDLMKDASKSHD